MRERLFPAYRLLLLNITPFSEPTQCVCGSHAVGDLRAREYAGKNHLSQMDWFFPDLSRFADSFMSIPKVYRLVLWGISC